MDQFITLGVISNLGNVVVPFPLDLNLTLSLFQLDVFVLLFFATSQSEEQEFFVFCCEKLSLASARCLSREQVLQHALHMIFAQC